MKLRIEKYSIQERRRSWGACQENDKSDSAYNSYAEDRWRVLNCDRVLLDEIPYENWAKDFVEAWSKTPIEIKKVSMNLEANLNYDLTKFLSRAMSQIKKREKLAIKRFRLVSKGRIVPDELQDLEDSVPYLTVCSKMNCEDGD